MIDKSEKSELLRKEGKVSDRKKAIEKGEQ